MRRKAPRSRRTRPLAGREKTEEEKQRREEEEEKSPGSKGGQGLPSRDQDPGTQGSPLLAAQDPVSCQACSQEELKLPLPCGRGCFVANSSHI